jgi:hypothetical protein
MRVLSFVGMLTSIAYLLIYAEATKARGVFLGSAIPRIKHDEAMVINAEENRRFCRLLGQIGPNYVV